MVELLKGVLAAGELSPSQVGIVTPYSAQVRLLRQLWRDACHQAATAAPKKSSGGRALEPYATQDSNSGLTPDPRIAGDP